MERSLQGEAGDHFLGEGAHHFWRDALVVHEGHGHLPVWVEFAPLVVTIIGFLIFKGMELLDHRIAYWKNEPGMKRISARRRAAWTAGGFAHA